MSKAVDRALNKREEAREKGNTGEAGVLLSVAFLQLIAGFISLGFMAMLVWMLWFLC